MNWNVINNEKDLDEFNYDYGNFHDSVIKEISFSSGGYVDEKLILNLTNNPVARFIFQSECAATQYSVVEIEFSNIIQINIKPQEENYGGCFWIKDAEIYLDNGIFYFNEADCAIQDSDKDDFTWISAKNVKWRMREDLLGHAPIYMKD